MWCVPHSLAADVNASDVYMQFQVGWIVDPLFVGDYPAVMRSSQPHLPQFKEAEKKLLAGSVDFLALNFYASHFVAEAPPGAAKSQVRACKVRAVPHSGQQQAAALAAAGDMQRQPQQLDRC
jgi:beta-glucosidase/6-phospho-beta-glucosidase/beta-galactosidase